jgi:hypothetical protein
MPKPKLQRVFINIPYDEPFEPLYLAYITALSAMGFLPRATLGIGGNRRLDRIASLIESCSYSIHDLSRVQLDRNAPCTPRFNMPFELGLAVAWTRANRHHKWLVFESVKRRLAKSMSLHPRWDGTRRNARSVQRVREAQPADRPADDEHVRQPTAWRSEDSEQRWNDVVIYRASVFRPLPRSGGAAQQVRGERLTLSLLMQAPSRPR